MSLGSLQIIGSGGAPPRPAEIVDNEFCLEYLRSNGFDTKSKTGEHTKKLTGVETRWLTRLGSNLSSTDLAKEASWLAFRDAQLRTGGRFTTDQLGLIHSGGSSREYDYPACACELQGLLVPNVQLEARDDSLACTSGVDALAIASSRMKDVGIRYGLVAVGEPIGSRFNAPDSFDYMLFGDGGSAVVVEWDPLGDPNYGLIPSRNRSDGTKSDWTRQYHSPVRRSSMEGHQKDIHRYGGQVVSQKAAEFLSELPREILFPDDRPARFFLLPHNGNLRMIMEQGERLIRLLPEQIREMLILEENWILNRIAERGNTSSAAVFIVLAYYMRQGLFHRGDLLLMAGFGGGMSMCFVLYRWP